MNTQSIRNTNHFECLTPIFNVDNVPSSIDYYVNKLGFTMDWDWEQPATFASVSRDGINIFLCQQGQGQPGTWISIFVTDVDTLYDEYLQRGAIIRQPPTNFPWGMREMNIEDLDGHRLRIGTHSQAPDDGISLAE